MSGGIDECIKGAYGDRLKKITPLSAKNNINIYEINTNVSDKKEILRVLLKKCFNCSCLSVFKKNIELLNSKYIENENLLKNKILYENNDYLLIYRFKSNNKLEMMNGEELKEYFEENGSYILLKTVVKVLKIFHCNNLYHGAIKLSNIMISKEDSDDDDDKYEICDYFYSLLNEREVEICNKNVNYISPEELMNKEIGIGKDMWNIGILLYKILSGKFPFECDSLIEIELNILNIKYDKLKIEFHELLNPLIEKLLIKEIENRISIFEFENEIDKINSNNYIDEIIPFVEEEEVKFISEYKDEYISISEDGKTITSTILNFNSGNCYLNVKMYENIHHFIFKIQHCYGGIVFGCSSNNKYDGEYLSIDESSCSIRLWNDYSELLGSNGNKMKDGDFKDIFLKQREEYELIFNINEKTMSIKQGNGKEVLLFTNIKTPVYPFVSIWQENDSVSLIKYWKE